MCAASEFRASADAGATGYLVHNLVSDQAGVADLTDPNLVNAWGISITAASPFWVCDGGTGLSTVYTASAYDVRRQHDQSTVAANR